MRKQFKYFQNDTNKIDESFDFPQDSRHAFSVSYFYKNPIFDVRNIEERLKAMNLHRVKKRYELSPQEHDKEIKVQ